MKLSKTKLYYIFVAAIAIGTLFLIYLQRNSICDNYNLHIDLQVNANEKCLPKADLHWIKHFAELDKKSFARELDNMIGLIGLLFIALIGALREFYRKKNKPLSNT